MQSENGACKQPTAQDERNGSGLDQTMMKTVELFSERSFQSISVKKLLIQQQMTQIRSDTIFDVFVSEGGGSAEMLKGICGFMHNWLCTDAER